MCVRLGYLFEWRGQAEQMVGGVAAEAVAEKDVVALGFVAAV